MGRYTVIADVGTALVRLLQQKMVPETIANADAIGLCAPSERGDFIVGIHLYDIKENEEIRANAMVAQGNDRLKYPPAYISLYYMITVSSVGDIKFRAGEEHKILGRIIQILKDDSCLDQETLEPVSVRKPMDIVIQMQNMELEDKMRVYNVPNAAYKLSVFYKVAPIELESTKSRQTQRVKEVDVTVKDKG